MHGRLPTMSGFLAAVIQSNNQEEFERLCEKFKDDPVYFNNFNRYGETALIMACRLGREKMVKLLVQNEHVDIDAVNPVTKETAFNVASAKNLSAILDDLLIIKPTTKLRF